MVRMRRVAENIAAKTATKVDRDGIFPIDTFQALKKERLLGVAIPVEFGGEGLDMMAISNLIIELAQACGSSAMIYAMHQIKVAAIVSHGIKTEWYHAFMRRICDEQLLMGSATTEAGIGGDLRNSTCAVEVTDGRYRMTKEATCISYGDYCDAILATCRRSPQSASSDQVMIAVPKEHYTLEKTSDWDTMGMRGTCSNGYILKCEGDAEEVFPQPFSEIAAQSMLAATHIYWSAIWFGIASDAIRRAQAFVKASVKRNPTFTPPGALRLADAVARLQELKGNLISAIRHNEAVVENEDALSSMHYATEINTLKVSSSNTANEVVRMALLITGIAGYKNHTPFSVARHYRDLASGPIMINNDRVSSNTATLLLMSRFNAQLEA
nr:acyl-CoA dehydrogenase family protein [Cohaesibacter celericrescens]